jgi:3-dehydroquinate synthase
MAEVVKYGIIRDAPLLDGLAAQAAALRALEPGTLEAVIARCCRIKADVVGLDEREGGVRAILNFGHTLGHALEACAGYGTILHGEAVSIGMAFAARLSARIAGLPPADADRWARLLETFGLPVRAPAGLRWTAVRKAMAADKKTSGGRLRFVLAKKQGWAEPGFEVPESALEEAWRDVGGQ